MYNADVYELEGGRLVREASLMHPEGAYYIQCKKHPSFINRVWFSELAMKNPITLQQLAAMALDNCPYCLDEKEPQKLAFPPGAEL